MSAYLTVLRELLMAPDDTAFGTTARTLHERGRIDDRFMQWLDDCAEGRDSCGMEPAMVRLVRDELRRRVWLPPKMPPAVRQSYEERIAHVLEAQPATRLESLLADLQGRQELTAEFCSLFRHALHEGVDKGAILPIVASGLWDMVVDAAGCDVADGASG